MDKVGTIRVHREAEVGCLGRIPDDKPTRFLWPPHARPPHPAGMHTKTPTMTGTTHSRPARADCARLLIAQLMKAPHAIDALFGVSHQTADHGVCLYSKEGAIIIMINNVLQLWCRGSQHGSVERTHLSGEGSLRGRPRHLRHVPCRRRPRHGCCWARPACPCQALFDFKARGPHSTSVAPAGTPLALALSSLAELASCCPLRMHTATLS